MDVALEPVVASPPPPPPPQEPAPPSLTSPRIVIESPDITDNPRVAAPQTIIKGHVTHHHGVEQVTVNGKRSSFRHNGVFTASVPLQAGINRVVVTARDIHGSKMTQTEFAIRYDVATTAVDRHALVIGNANYPTAPLRNPVNDANDIAAMLRQLKFKVRLVRDASHAEMERAIEQFSRQLRQGGVGLLYYAGHGIQLGGQNYLVPTDANLQSESDVEYEAVDAAWVLERMEDAGNELNMAIFDACRDNPFVRAWRSEGKGLAVMQAARGMLIAYATEPGGVALDGASRNGIYTKYLLKHITKPKLSVEQMFKQVRRDVFHETNGQQIPWESSSLVGDFYFASQTGAR